MTMKLRVTNEDAARTATVLDEQYSIGRLLPDRTDTVTLAPGESREFYIHASRRIIILEKP